MDVATHHRALAPTVVSTALGRGEVGRWGEEVAARHLVDDDGLRVVARNWRLSVGELRGELDLVAVDDVATVVVCEVKTRRDAHRFGGAVAAVSPTKRAKVRALAAAFLREAPPYARVRLDLIAIDLGERPVLTHLEGAL